MTSFNVSNSRTATRVAGTLLLAMLLLALLAIPWLTGFSTQRLLVEAMTMFVIALAWNLLAGFGGLIAIGQHVFIGVGAYSLFFLSNSLDCAPWLLLPLATLSALAFALLSAWPMFRLSGPYFAVGTWVLAEMLRIAAQNTDVLGAGSGLSLDAMNNIDRWTRNAGSYWAALALCISAVVVARMTLRGRIGLALMSVRDSEVAATACGVSVRKAKLWIWLIAAAMTGTAGALAYINTLQVTPDASFSLNWTAAAIFIAVLGGIGTLEGPFLGTLLYFFLRESFSAYGAWYFIGLGSLAIFAMLFSPGGAWAPIKRRWDWDPLGLRRLMPTDATPTLSLKTGKAPPNMARPPQRTQ